MADVTKNHPAFPGTETMEDAYGQKYIHNHAGMTLRDYFAAKAMQGELACQEGLTHYHSKEGPYHLAKWAYEIADAMLYHREP
jgi:hypothetical protein